MSNKVVAKMYTNEQVVRLIAAQVVVLTILTLVTHSFVLAFIVAIDFALRAFTFYPSPVAAIAKITADLFKLKPKPIFAAPKKFASGIGFLFALAIFFLLLFEFFFAAYCTGGVLILFALLESVFKICAGCYAYDWFVASFDSSR